MSRDDPNRRAKRWRNERGAVSAMFAVLGLAILTCLGLVVDGGRQLAALSEARDIADNAARAGSQGVDFDAWRDTGRPIIDQPVAQQLVADYLANYVVPGRATGRMVPSTGPDADITVTVEVTITPRRFFLGSKDAIVTETATPLDGVVEES
jgi:Flp pilus assembly protein TadG